MRKKALCMLVSVCIMLGLLTQTNLMKNSTIVTNAAEPALITEYIDGREVIRITNQWQTDYAYGIGPASNQNNLGLFLNIIRNNPEAYIILETDIDVRVDGGIISHDMQGSVDGSTGYFPEVEYFNGVLDGNGHFIKNLRISIANFGSPHSDNVGMIHTLGEDGVIKNLTLDEPMVDRQVRMGTVLGAGGFFAYDNKGVIENCTIKSAYVELKGDANSTIATTYLTGGADKFGGVSAYNNGIIRDCLVDGMTVVLPDWVNTGSSTQPSGFGAIAYTNNSNIENCIVNRLRFAVKRACYEKGKNFTDVGGAVGVNNGGVSNVHVGYRVILENGAYFGDPGSLFYIDETLVELNYYKWLVLSGSPTDFGRVIGRNTGGTYTGLTSIIYDASGNVYTPTDQPYRMRMIGNDNGSFAGNNEVAPFDISVTFSQADVTKNGSVFDAEFSIYSKEDATAYYMLSDTEITDTAVLEASGTSSAITATVTSTLTLSGLNYGQSYTYYAAAKRTDGTWSGIKSFTVLTPKTAPELELADPTQSLNREYSGKAVNHTADLFTWNGDGELSFSYYYYQSVSYSSGIVKTTSANSGAAFDGAAPVRVDPRDIDCYYIKATLTPSGEYDGASITIPFRITRADTVFENGLKVYVNDVLQTEPYSITYGDVLSVKVKPAILGAPSDPSFKATGGMGLYSGDTLISSNVTVTDDEGYYTVVYDTANKLVPVGDVTLAVKYGGSNEMMPHDESFDITQNKKEITFTESDAICSIVYNGSSTFTTNLYRYPSDTIQPPCLLEADSGKVNIHGTITFPSPNAGDYTNFTAEDLTLVGGSSGNASDYYYLDTDSIGNGYAKLNKQYIAHYIHNFTIELISGELNFAEPEYPPNNEKGTFTYNNGDITYQGIVEALEAMSVGGSMSVTYKSVYDNSTNYTGQYNGTITFKVVGCLFSGLDEALTVQPLTGLKYGVSLGELFAFDDSKLSCIGPGNTPLTGTYTLMIDGVPFDASAYPKAVDGSGNTITHNCKLIFNSDDGTVINRELYSKNFLVGLRTIQYEVVSDILYYKPGVSQQPQVILTNKVGDDDAALVMFDNGSTSVGSYQSRIMVTGSDKAQYRETDSSGQSFRVSYQIVGLEFESTFALKQRPQYGDTWADIFSAFSQDLFTATVNGESISGTYRLEVKPYGGEYVAVDGAVMPAIGTYYYQVLFSCDEFEDTVVESKAFTVKKRYIEVEWTGGSEFVYNNSLQGPVPVISNKVYESDDVNITPVGHLSKSVGPHEAWISTNPHLITGADKDKYEVPLDLPTFTYYIIGTPQEPLFITPVGEKVYVEGGVFTLSVTGGSGYGVVTYSVPDGNGVLSINGSIATIVGAGSVIVTATKNEYEGYDSATATLEITIEKSTALPTINFPTASGITYGQTLSDSTLSGGSTSYGSFAWTNGNTVPTITNSGYEVTFTPNEQTLNNYVISSSTDTVAISVSKATPAVALDAEISGASGNRTAMLTATVTGIEGGALPSGTVRFIDTTSGSDINIDDAQSVAVINGVATFEWTGLADQVYSFRAVYNGDDNYNFALGDEISFDTVKQAQATLNINSIGTKTYGDGSFTLSVTGGSGDGLVTYSVPDGNGVISISGSTATIIGAGSVTITTEKAGDDNYNSATASVVLTVGRKQITVTADDKLNIIKGSQMPELTYSVEGLVSGDSFVVEPELSTTATDTNTVSEFVINVSGGTLGNADSYTVTYESGRLTVVNAIYTVTVTNGTGSGDYSEGQIITITADNRSGYTFTGWSSSDGVTFDNSTASTTTFIMPENSVAVTANYTINGGSTGGNTGGLTGGSSSDGSYTPAPTIPQIIKGEANDTNPAPIEIAKTSNNEFNEIKAEILLSKATDEQIEALKKMTDEQIQAEIKKVTDAISTVNTTKLSPKAKEKIAEIKNSLTSDVRILPINFTVHAQFAFPVQVTIKVDKALFPAGTYYLYFFNEQTGEIEECGTVIIDSNGNATFTITHCSDYFITSRALDVASVNSKEDEATDNPKTGGSKTAEAIFVIGVLSVSTLGVLSKKRRYKAVKKA